MANSGNGTSRIGPPQVNINITNDSSVKHHHCPPNNVSPKASLPPTDTLQRQPRLAMQTSPVFKLPSPYCEPSPNGRLIATLSSTAVALRSAETLQDAHAVKLPADLPGPISGLQWSPSSDRVLLTCADQIHVVSLSDASFRARIVDLASASVKPCLIRFGLDDTEVLAWSPFGLKLTVVNLSTSKAVEIGNPKFYQPPSATRGLSIRPGTFHMALLTRAGGKDQISIHDPVTRLVNKAWSPETVDAQGLAWTPDGRWLIIWESPAHGHRLVIYTPDGQQLRSLGPASLLVPDGEAELQSGIRLCRPSPNASLCAVCDHSKVVTILGTEAWAVNMRLLHPDTVVPKDTVQIWQEQIGVESPGQSPRTFIRATQTVVPPARSSGGRVAADLKSGCSAAVFDASSNLIATRLDESPGTVWIWDVTAAELRAVLIFHSSVNFSWHPSTRELLLVSCQDEDHRGLSFVWDPLSDGPRLVNTPASKHSERTRATWVNNEASDPPLILVSDPHQYMLVAYPDSERTQPPWQREAWSPGRDGRDQMDESALDPIDVSTLDDTFSFKNI